MSLIEHLQIRTPLLWVETPEPDRHQDLVLKYAKGSVYAIDPKLGFSIWNKTSQRWTPILFKKENPMTGETIESASFHPGEAIGYVMDNPGVMMLHFAHKYTDDIAGILASTFSTHRRAFKADDLDLLGPQFVLFTHGADFPEDLGHLMTVIEPELPNVAELAEIAAQVESKVPGDTVDISKVAERGVGLTEQDFMQACLLSVVDKGSLDAEYINEFKMSRIREQGTLEITRPTKGLDSIGGLDLAKSMIRHIKWMWDNPELASADDLVPLKSLLLVGVSGSGKSAICKATAAELGLDLVKTGVSANLDKFIGQSEKNTRSMFRQVRSLAPIVMWVDEYGRDISQGHFNGDGGTTSRVHGEWLTGVQELPDNVMVMAAANRIDEVTPEMLRAGRFDRIMFVGFPSVAERVEIFKIFLANYQAEFNFEALAEATELFTGAEIEALVTETKFLTSMEAQRRITTDDLLSMIPSVHNRIWLKHRGSTVEMYTKATEEWDWASTEQMAMAEAIISGNVDKARGRTLHQGF